jgi:hypothetical protein
MLIATSKLGTTWRLTVKTPIFFILVTLFTISCASHEGRSVASDRGADPSTYPYQNGATPKELGHK